MQQSSENPKYRIEAWFSIMTMLHSCLGLDRENGNHVQCKEILQNLVRDIEELIASL